MNKITTVRRSALAAGMALGLLAGSIVAAAPASAADGQITYTLHTSSNPTEDERDAYTRITAAMDAALARYNTGTDIDRHLNVYYAPGVPTAEANINGDVRFGANRGFMNERTALHEVSHTVGIGQSGGFFNLCGTGQWSGVNTTALLESWDGAGARVNCGGGHIWPYGLNYDNEMSDQNAYRHVELVEAMISDGM